MILRAALPCIAAPPSITGRLGDGLGKMMSRLGLVDAAAEELIDRYGAAAVQVAAERAARFEKDGDLRMHSQALLVLSAVERRSLKGF